MHEHDQGHLQYELQSLKKTNYDNWLAKQKRTSKAKNWVFCFVHQNQVIIFVLGKTSSEYCWDRKVELLHGLLHISVEHLLFAIIEGASLFLASGASLFLASDFGQEINKNPVSMQ